MFPANWITYNSLATARCDLYRFSLFLLLPGYNYSTRSGNIHFGILPFSLNFRRRCLFGILQVRGVNVHILYHGETHENAGMIKVITRAAVNVVPSECYHGPDGDANRYRIRQISPQFTTCSVIADSFALSDDYATREVDSDVIYVFVIFAEDVDRHVGVANDGDDGDIDDGDIMTRMTMMPICWR